MLPSPVVNSQGSFYLTYQDFWHHYSSHWNFFFTWFPDLTLPGVPSSSSAQSISLLTPPHLPNSLLISHLRLLYSLAHLIQSYGFKYLNSTPMCPTAAWLACTFGCFTNISNLPFPKPNFHSFPLCIFRLWSFPSQFMELPSCHLHRTKSWESSLTSLFLLCSCSTNPSRNPVDSTSKNIYSPTTSLHPYCSPRL